MSGVARGRGVAVTGIGLVTPAGIGVDENWRRVLSGVSAATTDPELKGERVDISCRVPGFDATAELGRRNAWKLDRFAQLAIVSARQAVTDAGLDCGSWDGTRVGVVIGNSLGGVATLEKQLRTYFEGTPDDVSALMIPMGMVNMVAGYVAMDQKIHGPSLVTATACASGASAIGTAREWLLSGLCDVVLAGGTESAISPGTLNGLSRMGALSARTDDPAAASRPFAHDRDGFVAGEGAAILVLERCEDATARNARRYADIAGFSATSDAHHATAPHPQGAGLARPCGTPSTTRGAPRRGGARERARHVDPDERPDRGPRAALGARRPGGGDLHQGGHRAHAGCGRRGRGRVHGAGAAPRRPAAHRQRGLARPLDRRRHRRGDGPGAAEEDPGRREYVAGLRGHNAALVLTAA